MFKFTPTVEELESREALFSLLGMRWPTNLVTFSAGPGVSLDEVVQAVRKWSDVCALDFRAAAPGQRGDIHVTQRDLPGNVVGFAYSPGPGIGGDIQIEPGLDANTRAQVLAHEVGHAIGLDHSNDPNALMYFQVNGAQGPQRDDVLGAQKLYGLRGHDRFDSGGKSNYYRLDASLIDAAFSDTANLRTASDRDWYRFVARSSGVTATVEIPGDSALAPSVRIGMETGQGLKWLSPTVSNTSGKTASVTVSGLVPGKSYYVFVDERPGAFWSYGAYRLTLTPK